MRKTSEQIKAGGGGTIDPEKFDSFTEEDIERMAQEDGENKYFPKDRKPTRVSRPVRPVK